MILPLQIKAALEDERTVTLWKTDLNALTVMIKSNSANVCQ